MRIIPVVALASAVLLTGCQSPDGSLDLRRTVLTGGSLLIGGPIGAAVRLGMESGLLDKTPRQYARAGRGGSGVRLTRSHKAPGSGGRTASDSAGLMPAATPEPRQPDMPGQAATGHPETPAMNKLPETTRI
ncbi:MAG TPA: hypothetical protein VJ779_21935 [Acetobacteraceae bacterium]|nr:hypothetical protein [Acetobacteraceae bacterium]